MNYSLKLVLIVFLLFLTACSNNNNNKNQVVIYVSVDQNFSSKILKQFEKESGIEVKAVYDTESSKAIGLEKRLIAEKKSPRADFFWNSEFLRTERLSKANIFKSLSSTENIYAKRVGLRGRVLIVNTNLVMEEDYPTSLHDLIKTKFKEKVAMSAPYFGTASTHFAALHSSLGKEKFIKFIKGLKDNNIALLGGNSVVKDAVGNGRYSIGLVDTDDALMGIKQGYPIKMIYYDQNKQGIFGVYQTLSIVNGAPNAKNAQKLLDYLSQTKIEQQLIDINAVQFSLVESKKSSDRPKFWTLSGDVIDKSLKPSIELMRTYLE